MAKVETQEQVDELLRVQEIIERGIFEHPTMRFFCVDVDEEMARALLHFNRTPEAGKKATNRRLSKVRVKLYADEVRQGGWRLSPQPIVFASNTAANEEELIDGQHRLMAILVVARDMPSVSVPMVICVGADHPAMAVIDRGKARLLKDDLAMGGYSNSSALGSALKMLVCYHDVPFVSMPTWEKYKISPTAWEDELAKYPNLVQALNETKEAKSLVAWPVVAVMYVLIAREHDIFVATEFIAGLAKGEMMEGTDPRLRFRNFISQEASKASKYKWTVLELLGLAILAFNAWIAKDDSFRPSSGRDQVNRGSARVVNPWFPRLRGPLSDEEKILKL